MIPNQSFSRPVPGESLTAELGSRPWQQPPEFSTVDEAAEYYVTQIANDDFAKSLIHTMKMGVPLTTIANSIQLVGVMEGKHSADVGILMLPIIMETMMLIGDSAGVEYDTGMASDKAIDDATLSAATIDKLAEEMDRGEPEPVIQEEEPVQEQQPVGLMARRN